MTGAPGQSWKVRLNGRPLTLLASVRQETEEQVRLRVVVLHGRKDEGAWYQKSNVEWVEFVEDEGAPREVVPEPLPIVKRDHAREAAHDVDTPEWDGEPPF
jgi:hypothetical protein